MKSSFILATLMLGVLLVVPGGAEAQGSAYVPSLNPVYQDLDVLISAGMVRDVIVGERPYSEAAFRRFVEEARGRMGEGGWTERGRESLHRLVERFAPDSGGEQVGGSVRPAWAGITLAGARSPGRELTTGSDGDIDAALNPLLQRNGGRVLSDGLNAAMEAGLTMQSGHFAAAVSPRIWVGSQGDGDSNAEATLLHAYARAVAGPVAVEVGRNNVSAGFGTEGGAFVSNNARGRDMIRLAADRPVRLPGPLRVLGLWQGSMTVADLGDNRDIAGAFLTTLRLSGRPSRYIEFGINYLNVQGGDGSPDASFGNRVRDLFFFWQDGGFLQISDKVAGADLRISVPQARSALYASFFTTDDRGRFKQPAGGYWEDAVWLVGLSTHELGSEGRADISLEWRHAGARAHVHHQFTSGVTLDQRVIGDPLGPNAAGLTGRVDWNGSLSRLRLQGSWERYSGDRFYWALIPGGGQWDFDWYLGSDNPDEIRKRIVIDYLRFEGWRGMEMAFRMGYEHVTRFDYGDQNRHNLLAQASVRYIW